MRCYASKQTIAQTCCLAFLVLFLVTFIPFEAKYYSQKAVKEQEIKPQKSSNIKSPVARSENLLKDTKKQNEPNVQIIKVKPVDGRQKLDNEVVKPIKGKLEQMQQDTKMVQAKPISAPDKVNKIIPAKENTKPEQIQQKTKLDETKPNSGPDKVNKILPVNENTKPATEEKARPFKDQSKDNRTKVQIKPSSGIANVNNVLPVLEQHTVQPVMIPNVNELRKMNRDQLQELYFLYIENLQTHCVRQRHIGNEETGGYHICEDVMNVHPCLMYSFGCRVVNDWSFDVGVSERYGCDVHSFIETYPQVGQNPTTKLTYHPLQLGGRDDPERRVLTLASIKSKLDHIQKKITILKLDTDTEEWESLAQITGGKELQNVKLLIVEFHLCTGKCVAASNMSKDKFVQYLNVLKSLYDIGFRIYYFRMWPSCSFSENGVSHTSCHDVHMMKK